MELHHFEVAREGGTAAAFLAGAGSYGGLTPRCCDEALLQAGLDRVLHAQDRQRGGVSDFMAAAATVATACDSAFAFALAHPECGPVGAPAPARIRIRAAVDSDRPREFSLVYGMGRSSVKLELVRADRSASWTWRLRFSASMPMDELRRIDAEEGPTGLAIGEWAARQWLARLAAAGFDPGDWGPGGLQDRWTLEWEAASAAAPREEVTA